MNTNLRTCAERFTRWLKIMEGRLWLAVVLVALVAASCAINTRRPTSADLRTKEGRHQTVVLIRVVTEIDGKDLPAFRATYPEDSIWLGLGSFSTGGTLKPAPLQFISTETRLDGWTYLLLEPGVYYLSPHPPRTEDAFAYDRSWKETTPRWRFEVPRNVSVLYVGTLFAPGRGRWMLFGNPMLQAFDTARITVRDESALAVSFQEAWLNDMGPLAVRLMQLNSPTEPIILETPPGR